MKMPAIRAHIGDWVYYVSTMRFEDIKQYVKRVDNEFHKSALLKNMLQRSITNNYKSIAEYIKTQQERFFNALVLAVYDGEPIWHEVRLEYDNGDEFYNLGILELSGEEKIFPVDGQHRVEGIKDVVKETNRYNDEQIPVIFIGHKLSDEGMQRSRRLFSTLNRYAKPVSMRDIIALDEDDIVAIVSRELIDTHSLFTGDRLLDSKGKAVPDTNETAFTTIITFYECNSELLSYFLKDMDVIKADGTKARGKSKTKEFIRRRPSEETIREFSSLCHKFWDEMTAQVDAINNYAKNEADAKPYRNRNGGNLLFRPAGLVPFVRALVRILSATHENIAEVLQAFPDGFLSLDTQIWRNILWNSEKRTMIVGNQKLTERILLYYWKKDVLTSKEIAEMKTDIKAIRELPSMEDVEDLLDCVTE